VPCRVHLSNSIKLIRNVEVALRDVLFDGRYGSEKMLMM
jgi:hypothetical protein